MKKRLLEFENILYAFKKESHARPILFELFMNMPLYEAVSGRNYNGSDMLNELAFTAEAFA